MKLEFVVESEEMRLSEELKLHVNRKLYKSIRSKETVLYVNGSPRESFKMVYKGDVISLDYESQEEVEWELYPSVLDILYEDDWYLVVSKRSGLLSIPTHAEPYSIYQEALYYLKEKKEPLHISILNRLDKDTEGLMVLAKNRIAANALQPTHEKMIRRYYAMVEGILESKEGTIDTYIEKNEETNLRFVSQTGKRAITHYRVLKEFTNTSLVEFQLDTGRTHQIRVHCKWIGHPIMGDPLYGTIGEGLKLASYYVSFIHPLTKEQMEFIRKPEWS